MADDYFTVALGDSAAAVEAVEGGGYDLVAHTHKIAFGDGVVNEAVDVIDGLFVLRYEIDDRDEGVIQRCGGAGAGGEAVHFVGDDGVNEGGQVGVMIIEGVAVDAAAFDNILDLDFRERAFFYKRDKRLFYRLLCKVGHTVHLPAV